MGQAKVNKANLSAWNTSLTPTEQLIADSATQLFEKYVKALGLTGACYHTAFFLSAYLNEKHGIQCTLVIGYVNDGTGSIMSSHAWTEFNGKKTDISLAITEHPDVVPPGHLLILDHVVKRGAATYTYHREQDAAAADSLQQLAKDPTYKPAVEQKKREHDFMVRMSSDPKLIREYLDAEPRGFNFERLCALLG